MMKKIIVVLIAVMMILALPACGSLEKVLGSLLPPPSDDPGAHSGPGNEDETGGKKSTPEEREQALANLDNYWDKLRLEWEWDQEDAEGYVWTITIDEVAVIDMVGLATVTYDLDLSCSHVGPTMNGVYCGELGMEYEADLSGAMALATLAGGTASYDADGWFVNDQFVMRLVEYDDLVEHQFDASITAGAYPDLSAEEQEFAQAFLEGLLGDVGSGDEDFELAASPAYTWYDWDTHMTAGDMSGYVQLNGIVGGVASASGGVDSSGTHSQGDAYASIFGMTFTERYDETITNPFPYALRVYETGQVVFELYSSTGGPITVKFYGTIDRVPVEDTQIVP